jgi:hypothetical protein
VISLSIAALLLAFLLATVGVAFKQRWLVVIPLSLGLGSVTYFLIGTGVARALDKGRFYSLPFGWDKIATAELSLIASLLTWVAIWGVILYFALQRAGWPKRRNAQGTPSGPASREQETRPHDPGSA